MLHTRHTCSPLAGPSRYDRRYGDDAFRHHRPVPSRNLGTIEGERKRHCRGYDATGHMAEQLAGLFVTVAILLVLALVLCAL